ncbi:GNAT family N-acetyltransferase [Niveibacterium sp.]|uniref:GNAT family N-acetyltransferase n=1 Tax=Niveibacterium sp. TaxID=2017444 RepID=UPI0035AE0CB1
MNHPPAILTNDLVRLRRSTAADARSVFDATSDTAVTHYMEWSRHTDVSETEAFFAGCAARWDSGEEFHWVIEPANERTIAGCIAVRVRGSTAEFGYFLHPSCWGKGLASAATRLVIEWAKQQPDIFRICATTDAENARSIATLLRSGLPHEGTLTMAKIRPNISTTPRDTAVFGLCRDDF